MDTKTGVYTYTGDYGEKNQVPIERVFKLSQLQRGDHIAIPYMLYWHHAIIEAIDRQEGKIQVIEYSKSAGRKVQRRIYTFHVGYMYLIIYRECLDAEKVVSNAKRKLGERNYHLITNNCEHFATWCKTHIPSSEQVERWVDIMVMMATIIVLILVYIRQKLKRS